MNSSDSASNLRQFIRHFLELPKISDARLDNEAHGVSDRLIEARESIERMGSEEMALEVKNLLDENLWITAYCGGTTLEPHNVREGLLEQRDILSLSVVEYESRLLKIEKIRRGRDRLSRNFATNARVILGLVDEILPVEFILNYPILTFITKDVGRGRFRVRLSLPRGAIRIYNLGNDFPALHPEVDLRNGSFNQYPDTADHLEAMKDAADNLDLLLLVDLIVRRLAPKEKR